MLSPFDIACYFSSFYAYRLIGRLLGQRSEETASCSSLSARSLDLIASRAIKLKEILRIYTARLARASRPPFPESHHSFILVLCIISLKLFPLFQYFFEHFAAQRPVSRGVGLHSGCREDPVHFLLSLFLFISLGLLQ
jgi:hypothetical protein